MVDLNPHILDVLLSRFDDSLEQTITELEATTTNTLLVVTFSLDSKSRPEIDRRAIERLCRCLYNLRNHNPNHPLDELILVDAKKMTVTLSISSWSLRNTSGSSI